MKLELLFSLTMMMMKGSLGDVYNKAGVNYVYDNNELFSVDTCITQDSTVVAYQCIDSTTIRKHYWYTSSDWDCIYGYGSDYWYDYSSYSMDFECGESNQNAFYFYNYSYYSYSWYYDCPREDYDYYYDVTTSVTGVCVPGSKGYYVWDCDSSSYYLYRKWYSDRYCSNYLSTESLYCNTSSWCSNSLTYSSYGYSDYYWDTSSVSIAAGAIIGIVIACIVAFCVFIALCCWCSGASIKVLGGGYRSPVVVTTTTQPKPVTTMTIQQTTIQQRPQTQPQYVTTTQPQYYPQQQYMPQQQQYVQQPYMQQQHQQYIQPQYIQQPNNNNPQSNPVFMPQPMYSKQPISNYVTPSQPGVSDYKTPSAPQYTVTNTGTNSNFVPTTFEEPGSEVEGTNNVTSS